MDILKRTLMVAGMLSSIAPTHAVPTPSSSTESDLSEIVVTATKTGDVSVQSAPFTVQALGEDQITRAKLQGFDDYSKLIAGLSALNEGPDQTRIIIRGITAAQ